MRPSPSPPVASLSSALMEVLIGFWASTEARIASQDEGGFLLGTSVSRSGKGEETLVRIIMVKAGLTGVVCWVAGWPRME